MRPVFPDYNGYPAANSYKFPISQTACQTNESADKTTAGQAFRAWFPGAIKLNEQRFLLDFTVEVASLSFGRNASCIRIFAIMALSTLFAGG